MTKNELIREIFKAFEGKQISEDRDFTKGMQEGFKYAINMLDICDTLQDTLQNCIAEVAQYDGYITALETVNTIFLRYLSKEKKDEL